jgi:V8-like Glu-specific endopeptidase
MASSEEIDNKKRHARARLFMLTGLVLFLASVAVLFLIVKNPKQLQGLDYKGIIINRHPLPFKKRAFTDTGTVSATDYLLKTKEFDSLIKTTEQDTVVATEIRREKVYHIEEQMGELDRKAFATIQSICGDIDHSEEIEKYVARMGIPKDFVLRVGRSVGMLRWNSDFGNAFHGEGDNEGDVKGVNWASGCLIGDSYFITAGHCFEPMVNEYVTPIKGHLALESKDLAKLMNVVFNYETDASTGLIRKDTMSFPVLELVEYRHGGRDYSIVRLGKNNGQDPGKLFGYLKADPQESTNTQQTVCLIQYPLGEAKRVDVGPLRYSDQTFLYYDHIDTRGGASGSPVISYPYGYIEGIHIIGGCTSTKGSNQAVRIQSIRIYSQILQE